MPAANPAGASWLQALRPSRRVAELGSLGVTAPSWTSFWAFSSSCLVCFLWWRSSCRDSVSLGEGQGFGLDQSRALALRWSLLLEECSFFFETNLKWLHYVLSAW